MDPAAVAPIILRLAKCSAAAYDVKPGTPSLSDPAMTLARHLSDNFTRTRGFIGEDAAGNSVIAVKGTASFEDMLADACIVQSTFLGKYPVHTGFREEFDCVWPAVKAYVESNPARPLFVTGHSLGGAIATLLALALKKELGRDVTLATFGSPRVGDKSFTREFDRDVPLSVRVVRDFDLVPRVPTADYAHVKTLLHLDDRGKVIGRIRGFFRELFHWGETVAADLSGDGLRDHPVQGYVEVVAAWAQRISASPTA
jgi:hypothetical protein